MFPFFIFPLIIKEKRSRKRLAEVQSEGMKTEMQKILFMDLDDTLLDKDKNISEENSLAIEEALRAGHRVVICTGRPLCASTAQIKKLRLDREGCYAICYNGGLIYDSCKNEVIFKKTVPLSDVRMVFRKAEEAGIYCQTYDDTRLIVKKRTEESDYYTRYLAVPFRIDPELPADLTAEPVKVLLIDLHDHEKLEKFRNDFALQAQGRLSLFFSNPYYLEIVKDGISKGSAIRWLCSYLKIPVENSVSAGDSENDIPMLSAAGIGCAMANATEACKKAADYITVNDCNHSAIAEIVHKFILGDGSQV